MAGDRHSALPVRTQADVDERLQTKIVDFTDPSIGQTVDSDGNSHVELHGNDETGADKVIRTNEVGIINPNGIYDATENSKPGNIGIIAAARNAAPGHTEQTERLTAVTNGTVKALDISLHDEAGAAYSSTNPLPITLVEGEGLEIHDFYSNGDVAKNATEIHEYVALADTLITGYHASASGKMKAEIKVETGLATGVFETKYVHFNSTAKPDVDSNLTEPIKLLTGVKIRMIKTNRDNDVMPLYSSFTGHTF